MAVDVEKPPLVVAAFPWLVKGLEIEDGLWASACATRISPITQAIEVHFLIHGVGPVELTVGGHGFPPRLANDDGQSLAGIFDILRNLVITADGVLTGEPEHVAHTSEARAELMDALAHMGLPDHTLDRHLSGNPVSVPALANSWFGDFVVGALPVDGGIAADTLLEWLQASS